MDGSFFGAMRTFVLFPVLIRRVLVIATLATALAYATFRPADAETPTRVEAPSGLLTPRFVSLSVNLANMRAGPGTRYPILWAYGRRNLPLEVIREYDLWRMVRDPAGDEGWMHRQLLSSKRFVHILPEQLTLLADPAAESHGVIVVEAGVDAEMLACEIAWCRLGIAGIKGWAPKSALWGVYDDEIFD